MKVSEFYAGRPDRQRSPEVDYGVHWWETASGPRWPTWRVSYVEYTGEVVAVEQRGATRGREDWAEVVILGFAPTREACERMLDGWAAEPHLPLTWARERLHPLPSAGRGAS